MSNKKPQPSSQQDGGRVITPNSGRNLPNMSVKTPMPKVKPPKGSGNTQG